MTNIVGSQSPFLNPPSLTSANSLAIIQLRRDSLLPYVLHEGETDEGYAEGAVINTRFGSFPHSTLIGLPWGSQVRASNVDTGSRGKKGRKRKIDEAGLDDVNGPKQDVKAAVEAGSGFIHLLNPTPETWTESLDHRTQVVYTPDYSYILPRLRVQPGDTIIEAGAGSGSFTHGAVRAVYSRKPNSSSTAGRKRGHVYSYEYHEPRALALQKDMERHGLDDIVTLTQRDVCNDGFMLPDGSSPMADAIFLDLPAPWQALQHLSRAQPSALNPAGTVRLCTFSPCIEQVTATVSYLRKAGWTEIEMVEVQHKRIDVRREQTGLNYEGLRGANFTAASVDEAMARLRTVGARFNEFRHVSNEDGDPVANGLNANKQETKQARMERIKKEAAERKMYKEGLLVHRTEPEVRTHTSYLVFAILPRSWTEADEEACLSRWPIGQSVKDKILED